MAFLFSLTDMTSSSALHSRHFKVTLMTFHSVDGVQIPFSALALANQGAKHGVVRWPKRSFESGRRLPLMSVRFVIDH